LREGAEPKFLIYHGADLEGPAYRVVGKCPPTPDDFVSYVVAGGRSFSPRMFFQATSVSMFVTRGEAAKLARGGTLGTCVAELDLADDRVFVALTNERTGHLSVWAPPRVLVMLVVNCAEEGK
jgi:hypothetical protein